MFLEQLDLSLFLWSTARWGAIGYVEAPELSSRGGEAGATWQRQRPPQQGDEVQSSETRGSAGTLLSGRQSSKPWDTWQRLSPPRQGGEV
jgi:hypothetical protein